MNAAVALGEFQAALAGAVSGAADRGPLLHGLSREGLAMTARVRASWCRGRTRRAAPLTLAALDPPTRERLVEEWVDQGGGTHSLFASESLALLRFLESRIDPESCAHGLCRFEAAIVRARAAPSEPALRWLLGPRTRLHRAAAASLVRLRAPLVDLLAALDDRARWPGVSAGGETLIVAPALRGLTRPAGLAVIALWGAAGRDAGVEARCDWETARQMALWGALAPLAEHCTAP